MTNPQQPELGRSGKGATSEGSAKARAERLPVTGGESLGPIPEDNLPGHHPEHEQDKPTGPPPVPPVTSDGNGDGGSRRRGRATAKAKAKAGAGGRKGRGAVATAEREEADAPPPAGGPAGEAPARPVAGEGVKVRFPFAFEARMLPAAAAFGVTPFTAWVDVDGRHLSVRFGPWSLRTAVDNVAGAERTGPYSWWKVAGPPHLSLADGGVTFATSTKGGVCVRFRRPVAAALPFGLLKHPSVTVTVDDPDALVEALTADAADA